MNRCRLALLGFVLSAVGCRTSPEIAFEDLSIQECVSALEAHGIALPPRTDGVYALSAGDQVDMSFVSYDQGFFRGEGTVQSWHCGVRIQPRNRELDVVFLSTAYASPLIGSVEHQHVTDLNLYSEVRVRHYRVVDGEFIFLE